MDLDKTETIEKRIIALYDATQKAVEEMNDYAKDLDEKRKNSYKNLRFLIITGFFYGFVLVLLGLSDFVRGKTIFGSIFISIGVFMIIFNVLGYKRNRVYFKKYFSTEKEGIKNGHIASEKSESNP